MKIDEVVSRDKWTVSERQSENGVHFLRFRNELNPTQDYSEYSEAMHVFWDFDKNENGMPVDTSIINLMKTFEDDIVAALESDLSGLLVAVLTIDGYRHWLFCLKSIELFMERLNSIPIKESPYPIELESQKGSGWEYFFENLYIADA